jgi:hypothetical protein
MHMIDTTSAAPPSARRSVSFAPQIQDLLDRRDRVFRIDETTVGVSDSELMRAIVGARPVLASERSVFKPAAGADIAHDTATRTMRTLGQDVTAGLRRPAPAGRRLVGAWPYVGISYLREWLFSSDAFPVALLSNRRIVRSANLSRFVDLAVTIWPMNEADRTGSALAEAIHAAPTSHDKRQAVALYRRAVAVLSEGVSALTANALWLMSSAEGQEQGQRHGREHVGPRTQADLEPILWETLRLLPPAWMLWRTGGEQYARLHPDIRPTDDVALFPLLMHRDREYWSDPLEFRPERWIGVDDPEAVPAYTPFGFDGARCWAKHLVVPLAARLLGAALESGVTVRPDQLETHVPLRSLLSVRFGVQAAA